MKQMVFCIALLAVALNAIAGDGKLIAVAGTTQLGGSAGGGIVPWAVLAGYDSKEQTSVSVFASKVSVDDFRLSAYGVAVSIQDRVELSVAQHTFDLRASGAEIQQDIYGIKTRLYGDVIYSTWPQISVGLQHKVLADGAIASAVGADNSHSGNDFYLAATKVELGAVAGYNLLWNVTLRHTKANQLGLLGFGGDKQGGYSAVVEASAAVLLSRRLAMGVEYRQKPDNLSALQEDDWVDIFIAWFPNKNVNFTAAWTDLGQIAGQKNQQGIYFSMTGYLW